MSDTTASLECPTMVKANGASPVMAIVEALSLSACRMRSVAVFQPADSVEFELAVHGAAKISVRGRIASREVKGARSIYEVTIEADGPLERRNIADVAESARRHAAGRRDPDVPTNNGLTRSSVRVPVDIRVQYRIGDASAKIASATNLSTGGMLMTCKELLPVGTTLDLRFALRSSGATPGDVSVRARIVAYHGPFQAEYKYNIAFFSIDDATRERLGAFVDATHRQTGEVPFIR